jgi:hypothetical protein
MLRNPLATVLPPLPAPAALRSAIRGAGVLLFWTAVVGLSYTQEPLFFSNQNHRFLPGLAAAGEGYLRNDWLAGTADPTPLFSGLVRFTHRCLDDRFFYLYYALLQAGYFLSLARIGTADARLSSRGGANFLLMTLLVALHSRGARALGRWWMGTDVAWPLQAGVAGQYVLGPMFQPSVVGVFLVFSIAAFLAGRPLLAILSSSIALIVHPTYLLSAAWLTAAYLAILAYQRRFRQAFGLALCALALALPTVLYNALVFGPSDAETFARANCILARERFPHHCVADQWLTEEATAQTALVALSLCLVRDGRLLTIVAVSLSGAFALTGVQLALDSDGLALLFPWRSSVYLVPLALTVVLARGIALIPAWRPHHPQSLSPKGGKGEKEPPHPRSLPARTLLAACLVLLAGLAAVGTRHMLDAAAALRTHRDAALFAFVRQNKTAEDVYLIPTRMERFRLATGASVFVDYKSHPYKDRQVLEWFDRLQQAEAFYAAGADRKVALLRDLARRHGVTHAVVGGNEVLAGEGFTEVYRDPYYRIFQVRIP